MADTNQNGSLHRNGQDNVNTCSSGSTGDIPPKEENRHTLYICNSLPFIEDPKLITKDIYRNYLRFYDLEINNQWQHFIFLAVFLVLCFIIYAVQLKGLIDSLHSNVNVTNCYWYTVNIVSLLICIVGHILSYFWIMVAKSTQARLEIYENAITCFEKNSLSERVNSQDICYQSFHPVKMGEEYKKPKRDRCFCTGKAGAFSIGKINWAVGFLGLIIWACLIIVHAALIGGGPDWSWCVAVIGVLLAVIFLNILFNVIKKRKGLISNFIAEQTE